MWRRSHEGWGTCICTDPTKEYVGNACVPKCGDGATRGEGGVCTCTDPTKEYVGNACVPKCGDGATRDGDTCYCTDPTKEYVGNACVPKCGDGATRGEGGVCHLYRPYKRVRR